MLDTPTDHGREEASDRLQELLSSNLRFIVFSLEAIREKYESSRKYEGGPASLRNPGPLVFFVCSPRKIYQMKCEKKKQNL